MDEARWIQLKSTLTGQSFQWVRPQRPELLGKEVVCRDVFPTGDKFMVKFDDGSSIEYSQLNRALYAIPPGEKALTLDEVLATFPPPKAAQQQHHAKLPPQQGTPQASVPFSNPVAPPSNMFLMFNSEPTSLSISLDVKLPDQKLLKLMYSSAEDKDKFKSELADYLISVINKDVILGTVNTMLVPQPKKQKEETGHKITKVG